MAAPNEPTAMLRQMFADYQALLGKTVATMRENNARATETGARWAALADYQQRLCNHQTERIKALQTALRGFTNLVSETGALIDEAREPDIADGLRASCDEIVSVLLAEICPPPESIN